MKSAWEKLNNYVDKKIASEQDKYNDGYTNQYDEWLDVKQKLNDISNHQDEIRDICEIHRKQLRERDNILCKYGLMHELIK